MIMKRLVFASICAVPLVWIGCSSAAPPVSSQEVGNDSGAGSDANGGSDTSAASDSGASDAGSSADATTRDSGHAGDDAGDSGGVVIPPPPALCAPDGGAWGTGTLLAASTSGDDRLDSVTPDELTIAWTAGASIFYADRSSTSDSFGSARSVAAPNDVDAGTFANRRAALSPDGLRLVVVNSDGKGFSEMVRAARNGGGNPNFGAPDVGAYTNIDGDTPDGAFVDDPIVDASDTVFYYSVYGNGATKTIYRSFRLLPTDPWGFGAPLDVGSQLEAVGSQRRRPTGISSDDQTLFYFDETTGTEGVAWINGSTGAFDTFGDLGARLWATSSTSCGTLYYSAAGSTSLDLFAATR